MGSPLADARADALLSRLAAPPVSPQATRAPASTVFRGPVVLIDGRSGSGKSELATALAARWPETVTLIRLDDIYPGWSGLDAASTHLHDELLASSTPRWQRYDWVAGERAEWTSVNPTLPLIVEGVGSLSRQNAALATLRVWVELDDDTRRTRALARDGDAYAPHWEHWAAQERAFIARERPAALADVTFTEP
ncbi:ATP-binding protein [Subtercola sp. Z020]|uniref:ATP-binding protein n=1 Tax=Subtercola sp. Z020 TaxID=2080582 RepID=UPI001E518A8F|nr:ATP-binding protein [Subtercola sp. Z020]